MEIKILNELPAKAANIKLSLNNLPATTQSIEALYQDREVQSQFADFEKNTSIPATVDDLLQAVDLIALAYQTSYDHGLKSAPMVAQIKSGYLSLVGNSSSTILSFKQKSHDAIFKLAAAGSYLKLIKKKTIIDVSKFENYKAQLDTLIESSKIAEEEEDFQYLYSQVDQIQDALGLDKDPNQPPAKFPFKVYTRTVKTKIDGLIAKASKTTQQIAKLFKACLEEIGDCSRYATEMEAETEVLITQITSLYTTAETAFQTCVDQDVTEKERRRQLEKETAEKKVKQAELSKRESELEDTIADVLAEEQKIEKKLEKASSRAFWSSIIGALGNALGAGLNAYATYQSGGLNKVGASDRLKEKVDQADKEMEKKKAELEAAKKEQTSAKDKYDALQGEYDVIEQNLKKTQKELKELSTESEQLESTKAEKEAELKKVEALETSKAAKEEALAGLEDNDENKSARETLQAEIQELEDTINEKQTKLQGEIDELTTKIAANKTKTGELNNTESDQTGQLELKDKEVKRSKVNSEEKMRVASALGASMNALSESMKQFHDTAKTEMEALSIKEENIMNERRSLQKERRDVVSELAGLVEALKNADKEKQSLEQLINALRITSETIQKILVAFNRIKRFWSAIKDRCHALAEKGNTVESTVKVASQAEIEDMMSVIDEVSATGLFQLVRAWVALAAINEATYKQLVKVVQNMDESMTNTVDVQQLCDKLKIILEAEEQKIDASLEEAEAPKELVA